MRAPASRNGGVAVRYICEEFYRGEFGGKFEGEGLAQLIVRAEELVDVLTHGRVRALGIDGISQFQRDGVKRACCLIVEHFVNADSAPSSDVLSFSISDVRVWNRKRRQRPWEVAGCGMWAWHTLMATGLMRGAI